MTEKMHLKKQKTGEAKKEDIEPEDINENIIDDNISKPGELVTKYASNGFARISDKPLLEGEEYEELRKRLRERKKNPFKSPLVSDEVRRGGCKYIPQPESPSLHVRHTAPDHLLHGGGQGALLAPQMERHDQMESTFKPSSFGNGRSGVG